MLAKYVAHIGAIGGGRWCLGLYHAPASVCCRETLLRALGVGLQLGHHVAEVLSANDCEPRHPSGLFGAGGRQYQHALVWVGAALHRQAHGQSAMNGAQLTAERQFTRKLIAGELGAVNKTSGGQHA